MLAAERSMGNVEGRIMTPQQQILLLPCAKYVYVFSVPYAAAASTSNCTNEGSTCKITATCTRVTHKRLIDYLLIDPPRNSGTTFQ